MKKIVVDCSPPSSDAQRRRLVDEITVAVKTGDLRAAAAKTQDLQALIDAAPQQVAELALNDAELAQKTADEQAAVAAAAAATGAAWVALRMKRDRWLAQTDWMFVDPLPADVPADKHQAITASRQAWTAFRQQLRDLPANTPDPAGVVWPEPPAAPVVYLT